MAFIGIDDVNITNIGNIIDIAISSTIYSSMVLLLLLKYIGNFNNIIIIHY